MKKAAIVILIILGVIIGVWMGIENKKLFELPYSKEESQKNAQQGVEIAVGMETWQVKQALGVPEEKKVVLATKNMRKEEWIYGNKCLYFTNGVLTSWQER